MRFFLENHKSIRSTEELASLLTPPAVFRMYQKLSRSARIIPDALTRNFLPEVADFFMTSVSSLFNGLCENISIEIK